jgi:arylsulfatase A-like enzyme
MKIFLKNPFFRLLLIALMVISITVLFTKLGSLVNTVIFHKNPNVVLITAHSLRPDHLSCYGYENIKTATINALSEKGILFENTYCSTPVSFYSYAAILTGNNAGSAISRKGDHIEFAPSRKTLPDYLKNKGYITVGITAASILNRIKGFDKAFDKFENILPKRSKTEAVIGNFSEKALGIIKEGRKKGKPLFIWLAYPVPEFPYVLPENYEKEKDVHPYDGQVLLLDKEISKLLRGFRKLGISRNALIIFTSATGESLGEHNEETHGIFLYNSSVKVPLIIKLPDGKYPGEKTDEPASHVDILPTVLGVLKIQYDPQFVDGISLLPLEEKKARSLYLESLNGYYNFSWSPAVASITDDYKYIALPAEELYDLEKDPHEFKNIADKFPQRTKEMKDELLQYVKKNRPELYDKLGTGADPKEKIGLIRPMRFIGGDITGAISFYNKLLERDPRNKTFKYILARFYYQAERFDKSRKELLELTKSDPGFNRAWELLGMIYDKEGDLDKAIESYEKALAIYPDSPGTLNNLAWDYASKSMNLEKALKYSEKANSLVPDSPPFLDTLAEIHEKMGNKDKSRELREKIKKLEEAD